MAQQQQPQSVPELLASIRAVDLVQQGRAAAGAGGGAAGGKQPVVVFVDAQATVEHALEQLIDNNILSAPIWDAEAQRCVGLVDVDDLVAFIVLIFRQTRLVEPTNLRQLIALGRRFTQERITKIADLSLRNPFVPVNTRATLMDVVKLLAGGLHRVPIIGDDNRIVGMLSQSSIIRLMDREMERFGPKMRMTLRQLGMDRKEQMITIHQNATAIDAMYMMHEKRVSALPVVDSTGKLVTNVSVSDVKLVARANNVNFMIMLLPVIQFVGRVRDAQSTGMDSDPSVQGTPWWTLEGVVRRLAATRMHRLYVVDDHQRPIGVVSITDILQELAKTTPTTPGAGGVADGGGMGGGGGAHHSHARSHSGNMPAPA